MAETKWQQVAPIFLAGVGLGAALGILFAPKSGDETRDQISGAVRDGIDDFASQGSRLNRRAQLAVEDLKEQAQEVVEAGEQAFRDARKAAAS